jgi:hypothetical protein
MDHAAPDAFGVVESAMHVAAKRLDALGQGRKAKPFSPLAGSPDGIPICTKGKPRSASQRRISAAGTL